MAQVIPELATWVDEETALAIHERQLAEHGGLSGVRDAGLLSSALARPQQLAAYGDAPSIAALAASYAYGIARNHPFADGNKRTALVVSIVFLELNGYSIEVDMAEAYQTFYDLAAGKIGEEQLAAWFKSVLVTVEADA
jgi:death on curing protein